MLSAAVEQSCLYSQNQGQASRLISCYAKSEFENLNLDFPKSASEAKTRTGIQHAATRSLKLHPLS